MECLAIDPLCGAQPIQVRGDASVVHGPAGACDHAEVDVLRGQYHVAFQHEADLLSLLRETVRHRLNRGGPEPRPAHRNDHPGARHRLLRRETAH